MCFPPRSFRLRRWSTSPLPLSVSDCAISHGVSHERSHVRLASERLVSRRNSRGGLFQAFYRSLDQRFRLSLCRRRRHRRHRRCRGRLALEPAPRVHRVLPFLLAGQAVHPTFARPTADPKANPRPKLSACPALSCYSRARIRVVRPMLVGETRARIAPIVVDARSEFGRKVALEMEIRLSPRPTSYYPYLPPLFSARVLLLGRLAEEPAEASRGLDVARLSSPHRRKLDSPASNESHLANDTGNRASVLADVLSGKGKKEGERETKRISGIGGKHAEHFARPDKSASDQTGYFCNTRPATRCMISLARDEKFPTRVAFIRRRVAASGQGEPSGSRSTNRAGACHVRANLKGARGKSASGGSTRARGSRALIR